MVRSVQASYIVTYDVQQEYDDLVAFLTNNDKWTITSQDDVAKVISFSGLYTT